MDSSGVEGATTRDGLEKLLRLLEHLLAVQATSLHPALDEVSDLILAAVGADKIDVFLKDPATDTIVAMGTSNSPMGRHQHDAGLERLQLSNGGRAVEVYQTGASYRSGQVDQDMGELLGIREELGVRSEIALPIDLSGRRRGVLLACSGQPNAFSDDDFQFLKAAASWIALIAHRAELVERLRCEAAAEAEHLTAEQLITVLAHDLGNFLNPLLGRVHLLHARAERDGRSDDLHDIKTMMRGLSRLRTLIADLLDAGRIKQDLFTLLRQPVNLAELARETVELLRTSTSTIEVRAPDELMAAVDRERVRQVLENLLTNAMKHGPPRSPILVDVSSQPSAAGDSVVITVRDEGSGITPEMRQQIFKRFVTGRHSRGLGLGLYLARTIAEAHGGTLTVESAVGAGTTFRLELPVTPLQDEVE